MKNASKKFLFIALMVVVTLSLSGIAISARTATSEVRENALNKAIEQAGVNADEIYDVEIEVERKKGVEIVEVEFEAKGKDYEYHINKETGEIIDSKVKNDKYLTPDTATDTEISEKDKIAKEAALAIAIKDAGINEADVRDLDIELDKEREIFVYEIDFETYNNRQEIEYEYDINAATGEIIKKEIERDG